MINFNRVLLIMLVTVFLISNIGFAQSVVRLKKESDSTVTQKTVKPLIAKKKLIKAVNKNSPVIVKQGKKVFLKFSTKVAKVDLFDARSKKLGSFGNGTAFDITKIIQKSQGSKLKVVYFNSDMGNSVSAKFKKLNPRDRIIEYMKVPALMQVKPGDLVLINRSGDRNEPGNNNINGSVSVFGGDITGNVGDGDSGDYIHYTTPGGGFGHYVEVRRISGNIKIHIFDPIKGRLTWDRNKVWISLAPRTKFYIQIEPDTVAATEYKINIKVKPIPDALEPNDILSQAKSLNVSGTRYLCNKITAAGVGPYDLQGLWDTYRVDGHHGETMNISLSNAGLPSGTSVVADIFDSGGTRLDSFTGNSNGISFSYLKGSASVCYIMFYDSYSNSSITGHYDALFPYGEGTGPACFRGSGYNLNITFR
jgi:hypothetical protein